jgi:hypothetical protein
MCDYNKIEIKSPQQKKMQKILKYMPTEKHITP